MTPKDDPTAASVPTVERIDAMREALHSVDLRLNPSIRDEIDAALWALHQITLKRGRGRSEATTSAAASAVMHRLIAQLSIPQITAAAMGLGSRASPSELDTLAREYRKYKAQGRLGKIEVAPIHPVVEARLPASAKSRKKSGFK